MACGGVVDNRVKENSNRKLSGVGKQIEAVRRIRGFNRLRVAQESDISKTRLDEIINGRYDPKIEIVDQIAKGLDIPSDYLLIPYHRDFMAFAVDGYLARIDPMLLKDTLSDVWVLINDSYIDERYIFDFISDLENKQNRSQTFLPPRENIKQYRKRLGFTQAQAAEAIGVSYNHYVKYENGFTAFSFANHLLLCRLLRKPSECITQARPDVILDLKLWNFLFNLKTDRLFMLLELLRTIYEDRKNNSMERER